MRRLNPFANVPTIMTAEEIIEFAHKRSTRISMKSSLRMKRVDRSQIREVARLQEFTKRVKSKLRDAVEQFPSLDRLHPFYSELVEILVGRDRLKQALGAVYNCIPLIDEIANNHLQALKLSSDFRQMKKTRRAAKGRISSIVRGTESNIEFVIESKKTLSRLPGITPNSPTIVCAGFPNVGKSTLVREVSTAEPEIAYYPFTTKSVIIGHLKIRDQSVQIVDTPGVLDRPMTERNEIEREAIAALKYLANVIVFMIDPSETCGWSLEQQMNLLNEVRRMFPLNPLLVAINKIDITPPERLELARTKLPDSYEITAITGDGVEALLNDAVEEVDLTSMDESVQEYLSSLQSDNLSP
ncbi:GTP-binding protein [Candidatus Thorarchaeota archaeon]|jgi:nucleolar GTP-binding protein|nr:MAG: GTP-binding protein [Candidatus Thorarchaeota archaeon]